MTRDAIPPLLWPGSGRGLVVLPQRLLDELSTPERETLLAHELAHAKRRDHWIRPLEIVAVALYWWHPIVWWARLNLRAAEEKCCDSLVLAALPGRSRTYAESLLKTLEFLAPPVPHLATGAADSSRLKERVTMIMNETHPAPLAERVRLPLVAAALLTLIVSPAWAPRGDADAAVKEDPAAVAAPHAPRPHPPPRVVPAVVSSPPLPMLEPIAPPALIEPVMPILAAADDVPPEHVEAMIAIRRQELDLEKQMYELEASRREVQLEIQAVMLRNETHRLEREIARLTADGDREEAAEMERELRELLYRSELDQRRYRLENELEAKQTALRMEMRTLELKYEFGVPEDERAKLDALMLDLERQVQALQVERMEAELQMSREQLERECEQLERLTKE